MSDHEECPPVDAEAVAACEPVLSKTQYRVRKEPSARQTAARTSGFRGVTWEGNNNKPGTLDFGRWSVSEPNFGNPGRRNPYKRLYLDPKTHFPGRDWEEAVEAARQRGVQWRLFQELILFLGRKTHDGLEIREDVRAVLCQQKAPPCIAKCSECDIKKYLKGVFLPKSGSSGGSSGTGKTKLLQKPVSDEELNSIVGRIAEAKRLGAEAIYAVLSSEATGKKVQKINKTKAAKKTADPETGLQVSSSSHSKVKKPDPKPKPDKKKRPPPFLRVKGFDSALSGTFQRITLPKNSSKSLYFDNVYKRKFSEPKNKRVFSFDVFLVRYSPERASDRSNRLRGWYFCSSSDFPSTRFYGYTPDNRPRGECARPPRGAAWYLATDERGKGGEPVRKFTGKAVTVKKRKKQPKWAMY